MNSTRRHAATAVTDQGAPLDPRLVAAARMWPVPHDVVPAMPSHHMVITTSLRPPAALRLWLDVPAVQPSDPSSTAIGRVRTPWGNRCQEA